jgi:DNA transformation protein
MAGQDEFLAHVLELLAPLGRVAARPMFGGHGLYCDGVFFGIVLDNTLYLKADDQNRGDFERAGSEIFSYSRAGKRATLNFYRAPGEAMDAPHQMLPWARSALAAGLRARKGPR